MEGLDSETENYPNPCSINVGKFTWIRRETYCADSCNHCIRKVDTRNEVVTTIAGIGRSGFVDGNALVEAMSHRPTSLIIGEDDVIYVCDSGSGAIRKADDGIVFTLANGNVLVADYSSSPSLS